MPTGNGIFTIQLIQNSLYMLQFPYSYNTYDSYAYILMQKGDYRNSIDYFRKGLIVLKKYPEKNDLESVKKDSDQALVYIKEKEEKISGK